MATSNKKRTSLGSSINSFIHHSKKHGRKHLPTFHHMWHVKVDVHIFKFIFIGLFIVICGVIVIALMNATTTEKTQTTATKASTEQEDTKEYTYYYPNYLKSWPVGDGYHWQWTTAVFTNPHDTDVEITINIHDTQYNEGTYQKEPMASITKTVKARQNYNTYGDDAWTNVLKEGKTLTRALGTIEVISEGKPIMAFARTVVKEGEVFNSSKTVMYDDEPFIYEKDIEYASYHPVFQADRRTGDQRYKQFGDVAIFNPYHRAIPVYTTILDVNGNEVKKIRRVIEAKDMWNSWNDPEWKDITLADGWIQVMALTGAEGMGGATVPVIPLSRVRITDPSAEKKGADGQDASDYFAKLVGFDDQIMKPHDTTESHLYAPLYLKQWYESDNDRRQWNHIVVANPQYEDISATVNLYKVSENADEAANDAVPFHSIDIVIPARGIYNSYDRNEWYNVPDMNIGDRQNVGRGWMEVVADDDKRLLAINRVTFRRVADGQLSTHRDNLELFDDDYFVGSSELSTRHYVPMYLNNWPAGGTQKQFGNSVVVSPHTQEQQLQIKMYDLLKGNKVAEFDKTVSMGQWFNGYTDEEWEQVPVTNEQYNGSYTWVTFDTEEPVFGLHRFRVEDAGNDGKDNLIEEFDDDEGLFYSVQSIGGCTSDEDCTEGVCPQTSDASKGITAYVCVDEPDGSEPPDRPTPIRDDPNEPGLSKPPDRPTPIRDNPEDPACIGEDGLQREADGTELGDCCEGLEPKAVQFDGTLRCVPSDPEPPGDGQGWYAPDGRKCDSSNFSSYYEKANCDPSGKRGFRTELINPQSPCSTDGSGRCFITGGETTSFTSTSQRWLTSSTGETMICLPKQPTSTTLMYTEIIECAWKDAPQTDEPQVVVSILDGQGNPVELSICQGYWKMDADNDYTEGDYQNCVTDSRYTTSIRSQDAYHGVYIDTPRAEDISPRVEAVPAQGFMSIDKESEAPGIYLGWPKWEKGERTVKVVVYDDVSTESLSIEEIVADPVEGKRVETSGEITNVKEEEGIVYLLGQSDPIDVYFSDKSVMEDAVGAGGLSATVTGVIEIQDGTPIIRGDSITISE
jgi:hypothetical protein